MKVYISRVNNVLSSVKDCSDSVGLENHVKGLEQVLIKPNFLNSKPASSGVTTDLRILKALIKVLKSYGVKSIIIGETLSENSVFRELGVEKLEQKGVRIVNFSDDDWIKVKSPLGVRLKSFHVPKTVLDSGLIISAAKMKTHMETIVTLSIKNFFGLIKTSERVRSHSLGLNECLIDVYSYFFKHYKLAGFVDAINALEGFSGPVSGKVKRLNLVIAGLDLLSLDSACAEVMSVNPLRVKHLRLASKHGLGGLDFEALGLRVKDVKSKFVAPPSYFTAFFPLIHGFFRKKPFLESKSNCTFCRSCERMCPEKAVKVGKEGPVFDYSKCISCLVCCEMCRHNALNYKVRNKWALNLVRKIIKS